MVGGIRGNKLTAIAAALMALAAVSAVRIGVSGRVWEGAAEGTQVPSAEGKRTGDHVALARAAERDGDVTSALSHYRIAVVHRPTLVDKRSAEFLGAAFEGNLKRWVTALRRGELKGGPTALPDASYLFRKMYGGCG